MPLAKPVTPVDVVWKSTLATLITVLGIVAIVLGGIYSMPSFYAVSVVLANTTVYYLQHVNDLERLVAGLILAVLIYLAWVEQTFIVTVFSFVAVFVLAYVNRSAKFFWE